MALLGTLLAAAGSLNAGTQCATCHKAEAEAQAATPMGRATEPVAGCTILAEHLRLAGAFSGYTYEIRREGTTSIYTVSGEAGKIEVPLLWAFGLGSAGQTYIFERAGHLFESRVSFYMAIDGLDVTMGANGAIPKNLEEAAGRLMGAADARECFDCHNTKAVQGNALQLEHFTAGIQCERCHVQAPTHMAAVQAGDRTRAAIRKLGGLSSEDTSEFCGQCHRTWETISMNGPWTVGNVRFQPYRLAKSRCFDADDRRIACTSCHDPHKNLKVQTEAYDAKCTVCHSKGPVGRVAKVCATGTSGCAGCHMPKTELPGAHMKFTDHWIRVVRVGERYPN